MKRRDFLKNTSAAVSLPIFLNGLGVSAITKSALFNHLNLDTDRVLVLIQLSGGNDGLATVLPLDQYSNLAAARSNILIPESSSLDLNSETGLHPNMEGFKGLFDDAKLNIVQNVGYPDQNRSHFRSTDIWHTGSPADEFWTTGWLGSYLDLDHSSYPDGYPSNDYPDPFAITMGSFVSETCQGVVSNYSLAINDPTSLNALATGGEDEVPDTPYGDELDFLRTTIAQTNAYSDVILSAADNGNNLADYPDDNRLANQLRNIALLISGGLQTRIYVASLGGFDTHANQTDPNDPLVGDHANLLAQLSEAVAVFQEDLKLLGIEERVVGMTYSEFGRRIISNESFGTDHGSAAPMFLFGPCVLPGIIGDNPEIPSQVGIQDGVAMQYDFRDVYGSVLMDWFGVEETVVQSLLYSGFQHIPLLQCSLTDIEEPEKLTEEVDLTCFPNPFHSRLNIRFNSQSERVRLSIFDTLGSERAVIFDKKLTAGSHQVPFEGYDLPPGTYHIRLQMEGFRTKTKLVVKI